jgi:hypothetical protein
MAGRISSPQSHLRGRRDSAHASELQTQPPPCQGLHRGMNALWVNEKIGNVSRGSSRDRRRFEQPSASPPQLSKLPGTSTANHSVVPHPAQSRLDLSSWWSYVYAVITGSPRPAQLRSGA